MPFNLHLIVEKKGISTSDVFKTEQLTPNQFSN